MENRQRGRTPKKTVERRSSSSDRASRRSVSPLQRKIADALKQHDNEGVYQTFMQRLIEVDSSGTEAKDRHQTKANILLEFQDYLQGLPISEIVNFGEQLQSTIEKYNNNDSLDQAFKENRVIYKSWHHPQRISSSINKGQQVAGGNELIGADSLNVALDPTRFRNHKNLTKQQGSELAPLGPGPSSLLFSGQKNTVFKKDRGTATALLPENLYAAFNAYNETVKALLREKTLEDLGDGAEDLQRIAQSMRATVTRPIFFKNGDIQSSTGAYNHPDKPNGPHVRKTHYDIDTEHDFNYNPLRKSLREKMTDDPLRSNAIFYQTYSEYTKPPEILEDYEDLEEWNEIVVKYRSTGHMAGLHSNIRTWVPRLEANDEIDDALTDGNKYSEEMAKADAQFAKKALRGENFDPKKEKKKRWK